MKRGDFGGLYPPFPRRESTKAQNEQTGETESFNFPVCITFSLSARPAPDPSFSWCFYLIPLCLLPCYIL